MSARLFNVRLAALLSVLLFTPPFLFGAWDVTSWLGWDSRAMPPLAAVSLLAVCGPHLLVLWLLRAGAAAKGPGLALASATGKVVLLAVGAYLLFAGTVEGWRGLTSPYVAALPLLAAAQLWLFRNADAARQLLGPQTGTLQKWAVPGLVLYFPLPFFVALLVPGAIPRQRTFSNESNAIGQLRTLTAAAGRYQYAYASGFPASLAVLASPAAGAPADCTASGLLDHFTELRQGYRFEYRPGPPVERAAAGCPAGARSYTVGARPHTYRETGVRSFYADDSGLIRFTRENRAATAVDASLR